MDWLHALFTDENSIAHIVLLYAFVIAVGVLLGKIKFFGVHSPASPSEPPDTNFYF